jgi:hypothetical protein
MSRRDPTLPSPETAGLPEADLIARVKTDRDSAALLELVNRHTGIYFQVVNRYAATYPNVIKARELDDDKLFNLDRFICDFDPTRGTKLCGYIHDRTDYLCKGMLKRDERNPLSAGVYTPSGVRPLDVNEDTYATRGGGVVTLQDESASSRVAETANADIALDDILKTAHELCDDPRFFQIWDYRHKQGLTWRAIAQKIGCSHEGARTVIYQATLDRVKAHLNR